MCLDIWPIAVATIKLPTRANTTARGSAPAPNDAPVLMAYAAPAPGAIVAIATKSTPGNLITPLARPGSSEPDSIGRTTLSATSGLAVMSVSIHVHRGCGDLD